MQRIFLLFFLFIATVGLYGQTTIFFEDFESGILNPTNWTANPGAVNGLAAAVNSTSSCSGTYHLRLSKTLDAGGINMASADLTLNLAAYVDSQLTLSYCSYRYFDESQATDGVFVSNNSGSTFTKIISFNPSDWNNASWGTRVPYDLDQLLREAFGSVPSQVVLRFQQSGTGDWNTSGDEDGIGIDDIIIATERAVSYATVPYFEDFGSGVFSSEWRISSREANDSLSLAPGVDYLTRFPLIEITGFNNWLLLGKSSDFEDDNLNAIDLHLKLESYVDSQLLFSYATSDENEEDHPNLEGVYASIDEGASFQQIIQYDPDIWVQFFGERVPYDLDQLLKDAFAISVLPDSLILRFQQFDDDDINAGGGEDGILLDNIRIAVQPSVHYASIPYFQDFETAVFEQEYRVSSEQAVGQTTLSPSSTLLTRYYLNEVSNVPNAVSGTYVVRMGKIGEAEGDNVNAFDLHLNLEGESQVQLSYNILSWFDEQQIEDGIWLSVDAGATFTKIYNFDLANLAVNTWVQQTLDLSALATTYNLVFSDSTILRFQQFGEGTFSTNGIEEDGLIFDDINVSCLAKTADFLFDVDCSTLQVDFTDLTQGTNSTTPFSWDFDGDGIIDTTGNGGISFVYADTGTYDVTLYVGNLPGCGDSITKQIFIGSSVPPPAVTPGGPNLNLCQGDTLLLSAQVGYQGYLWSTGATTQSIEITTAGTYSVRGLGINGCFSTPTSLVVTERPSPSAPVISLVGEPEFCEGDSVDLVAPFGASSYLWNTGENSQTITITTSGTYSVQLANSFGCLSPSADTMITVVAVPDLPVISQAGSNWLNSSSTGETYAWFLDGVAIAGDSSAIDGSLFGDGNYTVQVANGECESELSDPFAFTLTSLSAPWAARLVIAPNPSSGFVSVKGEQPLATNLHLSLYNSLGQQILPTIEVANATTWQHTIDLSPHPNGIYHLRISDGSSTAYRKLLLQR